VHAEAFAAAYRLFRLTGEQRYLNDYRRIWDYAWAHLIDHQYGAWFRVLTREGQKIDDLKSPMGKVDYHTLGACWDVLDQQNTRSRPVWMGCSDESC
jgi:mannose/cellobiose epimerase-like protein (N-acyl-D-glucosamine 2-epimerase family)